MDLRNQLDIFDHDPARLAKANRVAAENALPIRSSPRRSDRTVTTTTSPKPNALSAWQPWPRSRPPPQPEISRMKQPQPSEAKSSTPIPDNAIEAFRAAYATHGTQKGYAEAIRAGLAAAAPLISHDAMLSLEQDAQAYLVRQLDIALNGEAAAAREPVLADLLSQCQEEASRRHGPVLRTMPVSTENHLKSVLKDMARSAHHASDFATTLLNLINTREVHCG